MKSKKAKQIKKHVMTRYYTALDKQVKRKELTPEEQKLIMVGWKPVYRELKKRFK